jgi:hypothetical protein
MHYFLKVAGSVQTFKSINQFMKRISMMRSAIGFAFAILCALTFTRCSRNEPTVWDSDVMVPLATGRLTLSNVVDDSMLYADASGLWHVKFERELADFNLDTIVAIDDTTIAVGFELPISGSFNPGQFAPDIAITPCTFQPRYAGVSLD